MAAAHIHITYADSYVSLSHFGDARQERAVFQKRGGRRFQQEPFDAARRENTFLWLKIN